MALVENPGVSVVAIDPGGTTGVAVYDAWDGCWYFDQIDAGRGKRVKHHLWPGVVESREYESAAQKLGLVDKQGKARLKNASDPRVLDMVEFGTVSILCDISLAVGPMQVVVIEDFILNHGGASGGRQSSAREGLSPVRITARLMDRFETGGYMNGDAWRAWQGFGSGGKDRRGVVVRREGGVGTFKERLERVEQYRTGDVDGRYDTVGDDGVAWRGGGLTWTLSMPSEKKGVPDQWIKDRGLWYPGRGHAMDALRHGVLLMRKLGCAVPVEWNTIWTPREFPGKKG